MTLILGNYDQDVIGTGNSSHPANEQETERELSHEEEQEETILRLETKIATMIKALEFRKSHNAEIVALIKGAYANDYELLHNKLDELL